MGNDILSMMKHGLKTLSKVSKPVVSSTEKFALNQLLKELVDGILKSKKSDNTRKFASRWSIVGSYLVKNVPEELKLPVSFKRLESDKLHGSKEEHKLDKDSSELSQNILGSAKSHESLDKHSGTVKIAAFDLDGTLVDTKSGHKFARSAHDWRWFNPEVVNTLQRLSHDHILVIFTNQGAVVANTANKSYQNFTGRVDQVVSEIQKAVSADVLVFAATKKPKIATDYDPSMRKPATGMWSELVKYLETLLVLVDMTKSFYVGDAAGRQGDFLDSDKAFGRACGLEFKIPEEIFIRE